MSGAAAETRTERFVFNIQRFSVHDGPGIRDLVFLKGCPAGAITEDGGKVRIDRHRCTRCPECVEACPAGALRRFGQAMSVEEIVRIAEEDSVFYARSDGGVTVSGGEPCRQSAFVEFLLRTCRERGIGTTVETTGCARWTDVERVCRYADLVLYDVKSMDASKHKTFTGVGNARILANLRRLARAFPATPILARTPVVPAFNDTRQDIEAIATFLHAVPTVRGYVLLAYHRFGEVKYAQLGRPYPLPGLEPPSEERMRELGAVAAAFRLSRFP